VSVEAPPYPGLGEPIAGPRALTGDPSRFLHLTFNIARNTFKLRFFGSALGYAWQLVRPLLLFGVLYVFFTKVSNLSVGKGAAGRFSGSQLLGCIVLFGFFQEATSGAVRSVLDNETLVRKIHFPRMVIPASVVLFAAFNLTLNLVVVFVFALIEGVRPMLSWLELPLIVGLLAVLATGLAMLLSAGFVYFRDLQPIWEVVLQVLFYASPVIIPLTVVAEKLSPTLLHIYMLNPLAVALQQFRHAIINHAAYGASVYAGGKGMVLIPIGISLAIFALGFYAFNRVAPQVAEAL
jgi:ABC-2 type transport system permease protein